MRPIVLTILSQTMVIVATTNYSHKFVKSKMTIVQHDYCFKLCLLTMTIVIMDRLDFILAIGFI